MKVNEIFYSLQGEGYFTGTPAVFLRLSGCNMRCWFCDTQHEEGREMTEEEIVSEVSQYPARHIVITGGEPALQLNVKLITLLHREGFFIQIETNGTMPLPALPNGEGVDWMTCSPKGNDIRLKRIDELKLLFLPEYLAKYNKVEARVKCLQPVSLPNPSPPSKSPQGETSEPSPSGELVGGLEGVREVVAYIKEHPEWRLSLQTHKMIDIQ